MRIGIGIGQAAIGRLDSLDKLVADTKRADAEGFATAWFVNIFGMDAMTVAALCGAVTTRIELGTSVVPVYSRNPLFMAQQALTTQTATTGRFALGLGLAHQAIVEGMLGLTRDRPLAYMQEYLGALQPLIDGGAAEFAGDRFRVKGAIAFENRTACPIMLAALGPRMLRLAGRETAGTIIWAAGLKALRDYVVPRISDAASDLDRPAPRIVAGLAIAIVSDVSEARAIAIPRPLPAVMSVSAKMRLRRSPWSASGASTRSASLATSTDSLVRLDSSTRSATASTSRKSATTRSPGSSSTTSPGTTSTAGTSTLVPPRIIVAVGVASDRNAPMARFAQLAGAFDNCHRDDHDQDGERSSSSPMTA
jgi:F420-dependent oxidoreductase-like protein